MTEKSASGGCVHDHGEVATITEELISAVLADECPRRSASIEEEECLFATRYHIPHLRDEFVGEERRATSGVVEVYDGKHTTRARIL